MERLRELRGPDTRERDLANILGFEHSRAVRWKEGQMYVDRAEYLVRLADALDVETMLLVAMASGTLTVEQAHRQIAGSARPDDGKKKKAATRAEPVEVATDASLFALDGSKFDGGRGVVLLIAGNGEGRLEFGEALGRHAGRQRHGRDRPADRHLPGRTLPSRAGVPGPRAWPTSRPSRPAASCRA